MARRANILGLGYVNRGAKEERRKDCRRIRRVQAQYKR